MLYVNDSYGWGPIVVTSMREAHADWIANCEAIGHEFVSWSYYWDGFEQVDADELDRDERLRLARGTDVSDTAMAVLMREPEEPVPHDEHLHATRGYLYGLRSAELGMATSKALPGSARHQSVIAYGRVCVLIAMIERELRTS